MTNRSQIADVDAVAQAPHAFSNFRIFFLAATKTPTDLRIDLIALSHHCLIFCQFARSFCRFVANRLRHSLVARKVTSSTNKPKHLNENTLETIMKTTKYFTTSTKDNMAFALALAAAAIGLVAMFTNSADARVVATAPVQILDTIVVTAPRIHTLQLETIVVTASRNLSADKIIVAAK
jgi:hypothetical protein